MGRIKNGPGWSEKMPLTAFGQRQYGEGRSSASCEITTFHLPELPKDFFWVDPKATGLLRPNFRTQELEKKYTSLLWIR